MSTWSELLNALVARRDLSSEQTAWAMAEVMSGDATPAQVAGFAMAMRTKGETSQELAGLVEAMLARAPRVDVEGTAVDTCGSGGDGAHTVNISTMAAVVVAAAGVPVVKHGNRAASSACGAADLLEALGVRIDLSPEAVSACVAQVGVGFCFAPVFHAGMRHAAVARRELGVATFFNFLGPLTNPARVRAQAVGISDARMAPVVAGVLAARGSRALVFRGDDGLDELTVTTTSTVWEVRDGEARRSTLDPRVLGLATAQPDDLRGGDAAHNADVARRLVDGQTGSVRDAVLLNAAAALVAVADEHAGPLEARLAQGLQRAAVAVDDGAAARLLERWIESSQRLAG